MVTRVEGGAKDTAAKAKQLKQLKLNQLKPRLKLQLAETAEVG